TVSVRVSMIPGSGGSSPSMPVDANNTGTCPSGSVTKRLLCIPVQSPSACKTRGEEQWHCPPRGEADAHTRKPCQDELPCAFDAVVESSLFVTLPNEHPSLFPALLFFTSLRREARA